MKKNNILKSLAVLGILICIIAIGLVGKNLVRFYAAPAMAVAHPLKGKKLSIVGDSISTFKEKIPSGYKTYYPRGDVMSVKDTWWYKLSRDTGIEILKNCSWSGSKVTGIINTISAYSAASDKRINDLADGSATPDIIISYIGTNDLLSKEKMTIGHYDGSSPTPKVKFSTTDFSQAYGVMLYKILKTYPKAKVYCCSLLNNLNSLNADLSLEDFNNKIKQIAETMEVDGHKAEFIDLNACGIDETNSSTTLLPDKIHPSALGHKIIAQYIKKSLLREIKDKK